MRCKWTPVPFVILLGLELAGLSKPAHSAEPLDDRLGTRTAPILLLSRRDVQADLRLGTTQISEVHRAGAEIYGSALKVKGKQGASAVSARRAVDEQASRWLASHLNERQLNRLRQIDLQWEGVAAMLSRPILSEYLALRPDQKRALSQIISERHNPRRAQQTWTLGDQENLNRSALGLLSDRQRELWNRLLGLPFHVVLNAKGMTTDESARARTAAAPPQVRR